MTRILKKLRWNCEIVFILEGLVMDFYDFIFIVFVIFCLSIIGRCTIALDNQLIVEYKENCRFFKGKMSNNFCVIKGDVFTRGELASLKKAREIEKKYKLED
jgi:hypothetical protein